MIDEVLSLSTFETWCAFTGWTMRKCESARLRTQRGGIAVLKEARPQAVREVTAFRL
jgi:hypothetical protein